MKICKYCDLSFQPVICEKYCSVKCRLLSGVKRVGDCWIWQRSTNGGTYGKLKFNGKTYSTHRMSYTLFKGEIPEKMWVCHSCDVMRCINPDHLFIGTASDNANDALLKNRRYQNSRESNHFSKLSSIQVEEVKLLKNDGFTYERLSRIFKISVTQLVRIVKNK
jgi:hypothetical protein